MKIAHGSLAHHIMQSLRNDIFSGKYKPGDILPSAKDLALRFGVSAMPVSQAFHMLEDEGVVICKSGAGTMVTDCRPISAPGSVALCIKPGAHLYGELGAMTLSHLHARRIYPTAIDPEHTESADLMKNALRFANILISVGYDFPFAELIRAKSKGIHTIAVMALERGEEHALDHFHEVLLDHAKGAELAAQYLWGQGCRRVVVLGTSTMVDEAAGRTSRSSMSGHAFEQCWRDMGGELRVLAAHNPAIARKDLLIDLGTLKKMLAEEMGIDKTGIFGLRDFEAWQALGLLVDDPDCRNWQVPVIGYGNTPWAWASRPAFPTIDWNLEAAAEAVNGLIDAALENKITENRRIVIQPRLVMVSCNSK